eukprot:scaffold1610_cov257-Pinguiococcus_pyrenoidosus.AAC.25
MARVVVWRWRRWRPWRLLLAFGISLFLFRLRRHLCRVLWCSEGKDWVCNRGDKGDGIVKREDMIR